MIRLIAPLSRKQFFAYHNPFTKEQLGTVPFSQPAELPDLLARASAAYASWAALSPSQRATRLAGMSQLLQDDRPFLEDMLVKSLGKSWQDSKKQIEAVLQTMPRLAQLGLAYSARRVVFQSSTEKVYVEREPLGVCLMFPFYSSPILSTVAVAWPALLMGNSCLLKHSSATCWAGPYFTSLADKAGLPGLFEHCFLDSQSLGALLKQPAVRQITYSGSPESGKLVFEQVASSRFINITLFFGGKFCAYVDPSADLQSAATQLVHQAFSNCGQNYESLKVAYVHREVADKFGQLAAEKTTALKCGDPSDPENHLGVMAVAENVQQLQSLVNQAVEQGANALCGGIAMTVGQCETIQPTILDNCTSDCSAVQGKAVGPLLSIVRVDSLQHFVQQVNQQAEGQGVLVCGDKAVRDAAARSVGCGVVAGDSSVPAHLPREGWRGSGKGILFGDQVFEQYSNSKAVKISKA